VLDIHVVQLAAAIVWVVPAAAAKEMLCVHLVDMAVPLLH
jgi:hypothetical protein